MAKFAAVLLVAFAFHAALTAPTTDDSEKTFLEELTAQIGNVANDITTTLQKHIPDAKDVDQASTKFVHDVESILKKVQHEIDSNKGKSDDLLKEMSGKLSESLTSLQQLTGPDATKKANELKAEVETNVKNIAAEFEKLGNTAIPQLQKAGDTAGAFIKDVLGDFLEAAQSFDTKVKDAAEKH